MYMNIIINYLGNHKKSKSYLNANNVTDVLRDHHQNYANNVNYMSNAQTKKGIDPMVSLENSFMKNSIHKSYDRVVGIDTIEA